MILVNRILGHRSDAFWQNVCDEMELSGKLETLLLEPSQLQRARVRTDAGTIVGVNFRDLKMTPHTLRPGSVVFYEAGQRVVLVRVKNARVLVIASLGALTTEESFALGHFLGELGWKARVLVGHHGLVVYVPCEENEDEMTQKMRACQLKNLTWTIRDLHDDDLN
jgi:urease accessory protein UreE